MRYTIEGFLKKIFQNEVLSDQGITLATYAIKLASGISKCSLIAKLELHHKTANIAIILLSTSIIESQNLDISSYKYVASDIYHTLTHNMFYSRQLSNYNLCIHVATYSRSFMCMWYEEVAEKGGNEVGFSILKDLTSQVTPKKHLEIWYDNCAVQNKNHTTCDCISYFEGLL